MSIRQFHPPLTALVLLQLSDLLLFHIVLFRRRFILIAAAAQVVDPNTFLRADFAALDTYTPVKPFHVLAAEIGVPAERLIKLDANEVSFLCVCCVLCAVCCAVLCGCAVSVSVSVFVDLSSRLVNAMRVGITLCSLYLLSHDFLLCLSAHPCAAPCSSFPPPSPPPTESVRS
jgi:hypothetical protein